MCLLEDDRRGCMEKHVPVLQYMTRRLSNFECAFLHSEDNANSIIASDQLDTSHVDCGIVQEPAFFELLSCCGSRQPLGDSQSSSEW